MNPQRLVLILLTGLVLGSSVVMTRMGIGEMSPLALIVLRLIVAVLGFTVVLLVARPAWPQDTRSLWDIALVGITNTGIPLTVFTLALQYMSSGVLTLFISLLPLFTALMAHVWLAHEKLNGMKLAGLAVALGGVLLLVLTRTTGLAGTGVVDIRGPILSLVGVAVGAAGAVIARQHLGHIDVLVVTAGQLVAGLLVVLPLAAGLGALHVATVTWRGWAAVTYTGLIGSLVGFLLIFHLIKRFGATVAALPTYVMPVVSAGLGAILLREVITLPLVAGAGLILLGVFLAGQ